MSKAINPMDDFDTGIDVDCGSPAAWVLIAWGVMIGCIGAALIAAAILAALAGVGR